MDMRRGLRTLSLMFGLVSTDAIAGELISEQAFTTRYAQTVEATIKGAKATVSGALTVEISSPGQDELTANLDNAYRAYTSEPDRLDEVIKEYVLAITNLYDQMDAAPRPDRLFPVVRDLAFIAEASKPHQGKGDQEIATMPLAGDLGIMFAFDLPNSMQFADKGEVNKLEADHAKLMLFAIRNFERNLPEPEINDLGAVAVLSGSGAYGSSLLLSEAFWAKQNFKFRGNLVAYVVSRDLMIVTGSEELEGLAVAEKFAAEWIVDQPYPISVNPVERKNGKWQPLDVKLN
jgi:uncharacterized protein YtpQ (UPF0354 family)